MSLLTGDPKESFYIGSLEDSSVAHLNQWPSQGMGWRYFVSNSFGLLLYSGLCARFVLTQA